MKFTAHERDLGSLASAADDIDYMHARFYQPQVGRLIATDPQARRQALRKPQFWNQYAYTVNNPLKFTDPSGRCSVPAGLGQGQVGICVEAFVMAPRIGGIGLGDGRGFTPNDSSKSARISFKMTFNPSTGEVVDSSVTAGRSHVGFKGFSISAAGTARAPMKVVKNGGSSDVFVLISGENGLEKVANLGSIQILVHLTISADGAVTVGSESASKWFPSVEGYAYEVVDGQLFIHELCTREERDAEDLKRERSRRLQSACSEASYMPACD